jgi:hypothetical protein
VWKRSDELLAHSETAGKRADENNPDPTALKPPFVQVDAMVALSLESEQSPQNTVFKGSPGAASKTLEEPEELFIDSLSPFRNLDEIEEEVFALLLDSELVASPAIRTLAAKHGSISSHSADLTEEKSKCFAGCGDLRVHVGSSKQTHILTKFTGEIVTNPEVISAVEDHIQNADSLVHASNHRDEVFGSARLTNTKNSQLEYVCLTTF